MKNRKVSVIIPIYKSERYIADILEDLLVQTYDNLEIILVNDGSPDNSQSIVDEFAKKDKRIKGIISNNQGVSMARNIGLQFATGEYVRFLDADDRIPQNSIQQLVEPMIRNEEVDIVIGGFKTTPDRQLYNGEQCKLGMISAKQMLLDFVKHMRTFYYGVVWNKLYKKEIIDSFHIQFDKGINWCEDYLFNIEYYKHVNQCAILTPKEYIYDYFQHSDGIIGNLKKNGGCDLAYIESLRYEKTKDLFKKYSLVDRYEMELAYLKYKLQIIELTKKTKNKNIKQRYLEFKEILQNQAVIDSFMIREQEAADDYFIRTICKTMRNKKGFILFLVMNIKSSVTQNWYLNIMWNKMLKGKKQKTF